MIHFGWKVGSELPASRHSGTATLLQIGDRRFLLTNDHVLTKYEELHASGEANYFQVGAAMIDPFERLIAHDVTKDRCTFDARDLALNDRLAIDPVPPLEFYQALHWPPRLPERRDTLAWAGFPGTLRQTEGDTVFTVPLSFTGPSVTRVEGSFLVSNLDPDRADWIVHHGEGLTAQSPQFQDFGGMSDGPVFVDRPNELRPELVALIYEHHYTVNQVRMTRLDAMAADGTISRGHSGVRRSCHLMICRGVQSSSRSPAIRSRAEF